LPPTTSTVVSASRYPYITLRRSLRLLIDDSPETLEEVENDIGYVYSGYAPISIRLVQCIAQKGGVLSNPAGKDRQAAENNSSHVKTSLKLPAHPILGWKGFEDIIDGIPGETIDIALNHSDGASGSMPSTSLRKWISREPDLASHLNATVGQVTTTVVFFLGGCTYTEIAALRWVARQNTGK